MFKAHHFLIILHFAIIHALEVFYCVSMMELLHIQYLYHGHWQVLQTWVLLSPFIPPPPGIWLLNIYQHTNTLILSLWFIYHILLGTKSC